MMAYLERIRPKINERLINNSHALSHSGAVREHNKYLAHTTCGDPYVFTKFGDNMSKDRWIINHTRLRTRSRGV
jgi:hypothetical protein